MRYQHVCLHAFGCVLPPEELTSAAIEEQGVVTGTIAANIGAVSSSAADLTQSVGGVSAAAEKSRAAAGSVFSTSADVTEKTAELRQRVRTFLDDVAAA